MSNHKVYRIKLTPEERNTFAQVAKGKRGRLKIAGWKVQRANAMLMCDQGDQGPGWTDDKIAEAFATTTRSLENWRKQAALQGPLSLLERKQRATPPTPPILDGEKEAQLTKIDYEYVRQRMCNAFMFVEPLGGWRGVHVSKTKTAIDWAGYVKWLVDHPRFADAQRITLVCDNLNTHTMGSLYAAFGAEEAFRLMSKLELVFTPKHGSWLNMAEPELSVMTRQCFSDRVDSQAEVERRIAAWQADRNERQTGINWQFSTADARIKLKRLYPKIELR